MMHQSAQCTAVSCDELLLTYLDPDLAPVLGSIQACLQGWWGGLWPWPALPVEQRSC